MKRKISIFFLIILTVFQNCQSFAAEFTDVAQNHWALPYISLAKEISLVSGYQQADGTAQFKPENNVSKQECLVMLCNTLMLSSGKKLPDYTSSYKKFFSFYELSNQAMQGIPRWAQIYIAYALKNGICDKEDFSLEIDQNGHSGGYSVAERILIAKWTARALGYEWKPFVSLSYEDIEEIEPELWPAAESLKRHRVMIGSGGKFKAHFGVKRSEMATICIRLLGVKVDEALGKITDYGLISNGSVKTSGLYDMENYLDELGLLNRAERIDGLLLNVDAEKHLVSLLIGEENKDFYIPEETEIIIDGNSASLKSLSSHIEENLSFSYILGESSLIVQSLPLVQTATIKKFQNNQEGTLLTLALFDGTYANYIIKEESLVQGEIRKNRNCRFIADGIFILEMR